MERVYQRGRVRQRSYSPHNTRREIPEIKLFQPKRMLIQAIAAVVLFGFIYTVQFFDNPFCNWVKNKVAYTLNYTVSVESVYKSSQEVMEYFSGKIAEGQIYINTALPAVSPDAAPASGAAQPAASPSASPDPATQVSPTPLPDLTQQPGATDPAVSQAQ